MQTEVDSARDDSITAVIAIGLRSGTRWPGLIAERFGRERLKRDHPDSSEAVWDRRCWEPVVHAGSAWAVTHT